MQTKTITQEQMPMCMQYRNCNQKSKFQAAALVVVGLILGAVNGLFGAGGGMLAVPALSYIAKLDEKHAHATAIAVILPLCVCGCVVYSLGAPFDAGVIVPTVIGVLAGGVIGALLLKKVSNDVLPFVFYGVMMFAGIKML